MEYPLVSEYQEAIKSAEDYFKELASLRPVLDSHGEPVMAVGNFAVVFKMKDEKDGKIYAVKCFIKDQEGRKESYQKIAEELEVISSSYILPLQYLENELFVESNNCSDEEFPVVVMEWVEGENLEVYIKRNLNNKHELEMLSYRFNRMAAWLLAQPFAHGDLKPDNILVRNDGSLVLVDYDGMFVPAMSGEKARETGSPDYRHPMRTDSDFNEYIDDFSIAVIALSLKAIALDPNLMSSSSDSLLLTENDYRSPNESIQLRNIQALSSDSDLSTLLGLFYISLAKNSLDTVSFRLFMSEKPKQPKAKPKSKTTSNRKNTGKNKTTTTKSKSKIKTINEIKTKINSDSKSNSKPTAESIDTSCTAEDISNGVKDEFGVVYSRDGKRLLKCDRTLRLNKYQIKPGTEILCDNAFYSCKSLISLTIPDSTSIIGNSAFSWCESLQNLTIPDSVTEIGDDVFFYCKSLQNITIPTSVTAIGDKVFYSCISLRCINIPNSVTKIGNNAFRWCESLQNVSIPDSVTVIGDKAFYSCDSLHSVSIPHSGITIGKDAFPRHCKVIRR